MTFEETVRSIKESERNVDKILRAARLERNPVGIQRTELVTSAIIAITAIIAGTAILLIPLFLLAR